MIDTNGKAVLEELETDDISVHSRCGGVGTFLSLHRLLVLEWLSLCESAESLGQFCGQGEEG